MRRALVWGLGAALLHRLLLQLWMGIIWLAVGPYLAETPDFQTPLGAGLPLLPAPESVIFGIWRRWDAIHYLDLAQVGYLGTNQDLSVFPPLTHWLIRFIGWLVPGHVDVAGMIFATLTFGLALALIYLLCRAYLRDEPLGQWAVAAYALFPLSHFFAAPMSDGLYLALVLGAFLCAVHERWWAVGLLGFLATITRTQGALLLLPLAAVMAEHAWRTHPRKLRHLASYALRRAWPLALIPLGALAFTIYRDSLGLPPMDAIYRDISYRMFVNPLEGLWINLSYLLFREPTSVDAWAVVISLILSAWLIIRKTNRRWAFVAYCLCYLALFLIPINYAYGTEILTNTQSFARYALALFPLIILIADVLRSSGKYTRLIGISLLLAGFLSLSARHVLGLLGP